MFTLLGRGARSEAISRRQLRALAIPARGLPQSALNIPSLCVGIVRALFANEESRARTVRQLYFPVWTRDDKFLHSEGDTMPRRHSPNNGTVPPLLLWLINAAKRSGTDAEGGDLGGAPKALRELGVLASWALPVH